MAEAWFGRPGFLRRARGGLAALAAWPLLAQPVLDNAQYAQFQAAETAFAEQRYADAAAGYAELAKSLPDAAEAHAKLGLSLFFDRRCAESAPAFERALALRPDLKAARVLLAICLSELGRFDEALAGLEAGYADPPDYPGVKRLAGLELIRSYLGLREYAKAALLTAELHVAHPEDPEVLFHANRTYREAAVQAALALGREAPGSVWAHQAMGEAYESRQFHDLAAMEYRKALAIEPDRPGLRFRLGEALLAMASDPGQAADALEQFELELAANPNHASAAYRIGEIYRSRNQLETALGYYERAVGLRPAFAAGRLALGRVLLDLERVDEAKEQLERAVELDPTDPTARYQLARACREAGDASGHRAHLSEYRRLQAARRELDQRLLLETPAPEAGAPGESQ